MKKIIVSLVGLVAMATAAEAHVGASGHAHDFAGGFMHPVGGADHILAMVAVGVFAAMLGGRARWMVPLSFVTMMVAGGILGFAGVAVPFVEAGILLSIVTIGAAIALDWKASVALASALAGVFAVFHGVAHGAEMPVEASAMSYGLGFVTATALLHGAGLVFGLSLLRVAKFSGVGIALAGLGLATGWL